MTFPLLAHHMAITILGREYEPHGIVEHAVVLAAAAVILALAVIGAVTVSRWIAERLHHAAPRPTSF